MHSVLSRTLCLYCQPSILKYHNLLANTDGAHCYRPSQGRRNLGPTVDGILSTHARVNARMHPRTHAHPRMHPRRLQHVYGRGAWEPAASSGRRHGGVPAVFWRCPAVLRGPVAPNPALGVGENPCFVPVAIFFYMHVEMWWICPTWPKRALVGQTGLGRLEAILFGSPPTSLDEKCGFFSKKSILLFLYRPF